MHQLTAALQKQQGPLTDPPANAHRPFCHDPLSPSKKNNPRSTGAAALPNGDLHDMMSIPVQCTHEIHENPPAAAAQCAVNGLSKNMGTVSDLLAEDMSMLCVDSPLHRQEGVKLEEKVAPLFTVDPLDSSPGRADHLGRDRTRVGVGKHSFFTMAC